MQKPSQLPLDDGVRLGPDHGLGRPVLLAVGAGNRNLTPGRFAEGGEAFKAHMKTASASGLIKWPSDAAEPAIYVLSMLPVLPAHDRIEEIMKQND